MKISEGICRTISGNNYLHLIFMQFFDLSIHFLKESNKFIVDSEFLNQQKFRDISDSAESVFK